MFIADYMTTEVLTISSEIKVPDARKILDENHFRHLPVVDDKNRLIGVVSDRDLRSAYPSIILDDKKRQEIFKTVADTPVSDIMTRNCSCLGVESTVDDAIMVFDRDKVGALPVVTGEDEVVGIFSMRDLTAAYKKIFGASEIGSHLISVLDDGKSESSISKIAQLMRENDIECSRIIKISSHTGFARIYMRVRTQALEEIYKILQDNDFSLIKR